MTRTVNNNERFSIEITIQYPGTKQEAFKMIKLASKIRRIDKKDLSGVFKPDCYTYLIKTSVAKF